MSNKKDEDEENLSSSSDDDDESTTSSSTTSSEDDEDDEEEQADDESDDNLTSLTPKQAHLFLETKRKNIGKRLLELRDELKAQPQADIDMKKRLLTEIKNLREKWIGVQTRLTNLKARLSHSPTPERENIPKPTPKIPNEPIQTETRVIPPPRERTSYSLSSRSRSSSSESRRSNEKPYHDLDALDNTDDSKAHNLLTSRTTTSYRDLIDELSLSSSPPESPTQNATSGLTIDEVTTFNGNHPIEEEQINDSSKEKFYNQAIPYPVANDKRDLELINRQLKNQLRELEASKNNPLYDPQTNLVYYERLKKQNEFINLRLRIEKLKRAKTKTQREKEQNKKQFHLLLQEFRKLQRFMRSANRDYANNQFLTITNENFPSTIPLPPSPTEIKQSQQQQRQQLQQDESQLPPFDLHKVTGKKILFESSDSDDDEEPPSEPQVPVSLSVSEPRAVPDGFNENQLLPLPMPSSSSSSATLDAIKNRFANLINAPSSSSRRNEPASTTQLIHSKTAVVNDDDDDDDDNQPIINTVRTQAISAKFNRKRRKTKRSRHKKKNNNIQTLQQNQNENEPAIIDQQEAWKRYVAMKLHTGLKRSNPILRALTAEAHKRLGISQEEVNDFQFDDDMMDYETALILQQQQEFLAAAAANPFNVLHNAAVGSSSSRPNLVDILANLNGGITSSSSEPQTPMSLLHRFFLDAHNEQNAKHRRDLNLSDLSTTPPTPPPPRDISVGKKIVESLTQHDITALLKLSGSEHDDEDDDDDDNNNPLIDDDTDDDTNNFSIDDDSNDVPNGSYNNKDHEQWVRPSPIPSRTGQISGINNKKSTVETLILPSFNRCTHLGKSTKRPAGVERIFPSFSKHNAGPSSTLSLILYGLSSTP